MAFSLDPTQVLQFEVLYPFSLYDSSSKSECESQGGTWGTLDGGATTICRAILSESELAGVSGQPISGNSACFFKVTAIQLDENGNKIQEHNSQFFIGEPFAFAGQGEARELRGATNTPAGFEITPKIRCEDTSGTTNGLPRFIISAINLKLDVFSQDSKGKYIFTETMNIINSNQIMLNYGTEYELTTFKIPATKILENLDKGVYESWNEFRVFGMLQFYWEDVIPSSTGVLTFRLPIPDSDPSTGSSPRTYLLVAINDPEQEQTQEESTESTQTQGETQKQQEEREQAEREQETGGDDEPKGELTTVQIITDIGKKWINCIVIFDIDCLQGQQFWSIYAVFIGVGAISVVTKKRSRQIVLE